MTNEAHSHETSTPIELSTASVFVTTSNGVECKLTDIKRDHARGITVKFKFPASGYIGLRVPFHRALPEQFAIAFDVWGNSAPHNLDVKVSNRDNLNAHWVNRRAFNFPKRKRRLLNTRSNLRFMWGPVGEPFVEVGFIELAIASLDAGEGTVHFSNLTFQELPADFGNAPIRAVHATSGRRSADMMVHMNGKGCWHTSARAKQSLRIDFDGVRQFDGLTLDWTSFHAVDYDIEAKLGGSRWKTIDAVRGGIGGRQFHYLPETIASSLRIKMLRPVSPNGYAMRGIEIHPAGWAINYNEFLKRIAQLSRRGLFPRAFVPEQSYWTVVGLEGGDRKAIINEEGIIEPDVLMPSVEPFVKDGARLLTWADGKHSQSLADGYLPIPTVVREYAGLKLSVSCCAVDSAKNCHTHATYQIENVSDRNKTGKVLLALRPFQVNPPWQSVFNPGGFSPVKRIERLADGAVDVDGKLRIFAFGGADRFSAFEARHGDVVATIGSRGSIGSGGSIDLRDSGGSFGSGGRKPADGANRVDSPNGHACAVWEFDYDLAPGESKSFDLAFAYDRKSTPDCCAHHAFEQATEHWRQRLSRLNFELPAAPELVNAMRSQLAYILINRQHHAIQPGTRNYRRSWIRDGSLTSTALLQNGFAAEVKQYIEWYAPFVYANGKVPCAVDYRGADEFPEHDSNGEWLYLVAEYYRYTGDRQLVQRLFPSLCKTVAFIDSLRQQRRTDEYRTAQKQHLFGLLPESASHEGYMSNPAHSYWDDIFCIKGLDDFVFLARELQEENAAKNAAAMLEEFREDVLRSIALTRKVYGCDYMVGAADRGDFDPTSTTIGLDPTYALKSIPETVAKTFEAYWQHFEDRRDGRTDWSAYTPYEWRNVGALLRLGWTERAHAVYEWFMSHRRPLAWNHWGEVVHRDARKADFIGDMPHGWVGSDFLRSARSLLAYEKENALVLCAGLKSTWLRAGVNVKDMITRFGKISLSVQEVSGALRYEISGDVTVPVELVLPDTVVELSQLPSVVEVKLTA